MKFTVDQNDACIRFVAPQVVLFEVDKKFQTVFIAFVRFYDLNDLKKDLPAISTERQLFRVQCITTYKNLHKRP